MNSRSLKIKTLKDKDSGAVITEEDVKKSFLRNFDKYDTSRDGMLDQGELTLFFRDILKRKGHEGSHDPKELAKQFVKMVDTDGNGKISREEIYLFYKE